MNEALVLLVLIWAVLLVPGAIRSRKASPHATVGGFERAMDVLRTDPAHRGGSRQVLVPGDAGRIVDREVGHYEEVGFAPDREVAAAEVAAAEPAASYRADSDPRRHPSASGASGAPGAPGASGASGRRPEDPIVTRRRARFIRLLTATGATLLLAIVLGGWAWPGFLVTAAASGGYMVLLRRMKLQRDEARRVVAELELHQDRVASTVHAAASGDEWASTSVRLRRWDD